MSGHMNPRCLQALPGSQFDIVRCRDDRTRPRSPGVYAQVSRVAETTPAAAEGL